MWFYIIIGIIILLLIYIFVIYNNLVKLNNIVKEAFSTTDVYLKKRWELIPNLVETVKGYAKHEEDTLNEVISLRNDVYEHMDNNKKVVVNDKLSEKIYKLMIIAEDYPDLKASKNFKDLSANLSKIEDELVNARKYYNGAVRILNDKIQMFPSNIIAAVMGFKVQKMFEASSEERTNIKIDL